MNKSTLNVIEREDGSLLFIVSMQISDKINYDYIYKNLSGAMKRGDGMMILPRSDVKYQPRNENRKFPKVSLWRSLLNRLKKSPEKTDAPEV